MREIPIEKIVENVEEMSLLATSVLGDDVVEALEEAKEKERSPVGREVISQILENIRIAREEMIPMCQDTGTAVFFVEIGQDVRVRGGSLFHAIEEGIRKGYREHSLRKSMVRDPLRRENTKDNTPPIVHYEIVPGDIFRITLAPKGGGSENMSIAKILSPAEGREGVKRFVLEAVERAGGNPCPPIVLGVGIGGNFEYSAYLAKKALLRPIGVRNPDPYYGEFELELLEEINKLGIGPMGLGGVVTALDVHIEAYPCHITSIPVAINFQCHADRHITREL